MVDRFLDLDYWYRPRTSGAQEFRSKFDLDQRDNGTSSRTLWSYGSWEAGEWHHIAMTWDLDELVCRFFFDGDLLGETQQLWSAGIPLADVVQLLADLEPTTYDELRISNCERYQASFAVSCGRLPDGDPNTLYLFHFDDGGACSVGQAPTACF